MTDRTRRRLVIGLAGFSAAATLSGLAVLTAFDETRGEASPAPTRWPVATAIEHDANRAELLVFVHPFCTCTAATISELARVEALRKTGSSTPAVKFIVFRPDGKSDWQQNSLVVKLVDRISAVPGASITWDGGGLEASRFGARTSGDVLLYNSAGELLFHGGITGSRGHEGDNRGLSELIASLEPSETSAQTLAPRTSQIFGCSLNTPESRTNRGGFNAVLQFVNGLKARFERMHGSRFA